MRVLVTGATGFVGGHLIGALRRQGHEPLALVRSTSDTGALRAADVPSWVGDLRTGAGLGDALDTIDGIIHCAGGGRVRRVEDFYTHNTRTTEVLAAAAVEAGVETFVMLSSYAAQGPSPADRLLGPEDEPAPGSHYGRSKLQGEARLRAHGEDLRVRILRAPGLHGAGERRLVPLLRAARRGLMVVPSSGGEAAWLHVGDLCAALVAALRVEAPEPKIYLVDDGHPRSSREFVEVVAQTMEARPLILPVPKALIYSAALGAEIMGRLTGSPLAFNRDKTRDMLASRWVADTTAAREGLHWSPQRTLEQGLRELRRWAESRS